jgi:tRNA(Ile)-lysidine synthase
MEAYIARRRLLRPGQAVLVGLSGGADSVALAAALRLTGRYVLHLGHVHHGLRQEADGDAEFSAGLARTWGLKFHLERMDTPALARQWQVGTEEAARRGRYEALSAMAARAGAGAVAVAHHADDQVETVLHHVLRGTHLRGLAGMPPRRPLSGRIALVRPLLWARREEIEQFCRRQGLSWRTDHTNLDTEFTRNFIRNDLLPLLRRRVNPRVDEALLRLSGAADQAEGLLEELAAKLFQRACRKRQPGRLLLRLAPLRKAPALLASLALRQALESLSAPRQDLSQDRFADLLAVLSGEATAADLPGGIRAERRQHSLWLYRPGPPQQ